MLVKILKGQKKAKDLNGNIYSIKGIELIKRDHNCKPYSDFYNTNSTFFKVAAAANTESKAYKIDDNTIMLL
jgi:ribosome-binding ATPase YchF (GTP1/OBG family)